MTEPELAAMLTDAENHAQKALDGIHALREASRQYSSELSEAHVSLAIALRHLRPIAERDRRECKRMAEKESAA